MTEQSGLWIIEMLVPDMQNVVLALVYGNQRSEWKGRIATINQEYKSIWNNIHCVYPIAGGIEEYPAQFEGYHIDDFHGREANHRFFPIYWPSEEDEKENGFDRFSMCNIWNFKTKRWVGRVAKNY